MDIKEDNFDNDDNFFVKPNDQSDACISFGMARKRRLKANLFSMRQLKLSMLSRLFDLYLFM